MVWLAFGLLNCKGYGFVIVKCCRISYGVSFSSMQVIYNFHLWFVIYHAFDRPIALSSMFTVFIDHVFPIRFRSFQQIWKDSIQPTQRVADQVKGNVSIWTWRGRCCLDTYFIYGRFKPWTRANGGLSEKTKQHCLARRSLALILQAHHHSSSEIFFLCLHVPPRCDIWCR